MNRREREANPEMMESIVKIRRAGVPCALFKKPIKSGFVLEPGFVLENGSVLLESEKDDWGRYIGGAYMHGMFGGTYMHSMYLPTPERYQPVRDGDGKILAFCRA